MKRIGILTAGGDTPALNSTIHGAVTRANDLKVEVIGLMKGFNSLFNARIPHIHLNPLFREIPELDPVNGGTMLGASRDYVDATDVDAIEQMASRLRALKIEGLICIGGDGTLNGLQPLSERLPCVLAPKTIDNDLGLNYLNEPDEWVRCENENGEVNYTREPSGVAFDIDQMINYVTPGYVTAVFVSAGAVERVRTTAESHRRIAIVEVMGRHSGYIALGAAYGQPDIVLIPECPLDTDRLVERVRYIYELQKNVVIVCGEGIVDHKGNDLGAEVQTTDPAGNVVLSGASEALRRILIRELGDDYFRTRRRAESARAAIFTRKVGHTQRGGRPLSFDRFHSSQLGGKAVDMLLEGQNNAIATLQYTRDQGFYVDSFSANTFRDRWGLIHARQVAPICYDPQLMKPSRLGIDYLLPLFQHAVGHDDMEYIRRTIFDSGNLLRPYHSVSTDIHKRIRYLS